MEKETESQRATGPRRKKLSNRELDREPEKEKIPTGYRTEREE